MKNHIILLLILILQMMKAQVQFTGEAPVDIKENRENTWHPHLRKNWINEREYEIVDHGKKRYPAFIQIENKEGAFLEDNRLKNRKMQCSCRFVIADDFKGKSEVLNVKTNDPAVNLLMKDSVKYRMKQVENQDLKDKTESISSNNLDNINFRDAMLKPIPKLKLKKQSYNSFNNRLAPPNINKHLTNNKKYNPLPYNLNSFNTPLSQQQLINLQPSLFSMNNNNNNNNQNGDQNIISRVNGKNVQSILNYIQMNSMIMKNIESLLLNQQNNFNGMPNLNNQGDNFTPNESADNNENSENLSNTSSDLSDNNNNLLSNYNSLSEPMNINSLIDTQSNIQNLSTKLFNNNNANNDLLVLARKLLGNNNIPNNTFQQ